MLEITVLYGCETECKLQLYENKVLRQIFRPKEVQITGQFRILHNEILYDLYR
jgi:hypothetical protein